MPRLKYKYDWAKIRAAARSQHQIDTKMGSVEEAVQKAIERGVMDDPYEKYRELEKKNAKETVLHASRGKSLQYGKHRNVLEIDVGGSGFASPRAEHAGFGGEGNIITDKGSASFENINDNKKWKVHWWNKVDWFQKLPEFMRPNTEEGILEHNRIVERYGKNLRGGERKGEQISKAQYLFEQRYGKNSTIDSLKDKKLIYVKETDALVRAGENPVRRVRYSMPGPLGTVAGSMPGIRNKGEYSIQNLSNYMLDAGKNFLEPIFAEWKKMGDDPKKIHPVTIEMKGHSRGGVAVSHGAMKIQHWINENYPDYAKFVKFETIQLDPVAGYGSDHGLKRNVNLNEETRKDLQEEMKKREMSSLGKSANTTVIYSLHTDHGHFFSPQIVDGAKRVILTTGKHSVNLENVDYSQAGPGGKAHRQGYMDVSTGEMYRNSGLSELPEGIYIADEKNRLIRIPNAKAGQMILREVLRETSGQEGRHDRINEVMENWFEANGPEFVRSRERMSVRELQHENVKGKEERDRSNSITKTSRGQERLNNKNSREL